VIALDLDQHQADFIASVNADLLEQYAGILADELLVHHPRLL
jgi:hypothetical protein